jgi:hypothetical protein
MAGDKQNGKTRNSRIDQGKWKGFDLVGGMAEGDGTRKLPPGACGKAGWADVGDVGDAGEQGGNGVGDGWALAGVAGGVRRRGLFALTGKGPCHTGRLEAGGQDPGGT